jgi:nitroreductase
MTGAKIPATTLDTILEATRLAPSSFGLTPYSIIVIEDDETRKKLQPHFYNQPQVGEASALIIFASHTTINEASVDAYMQEIAEQRGVPVDTLKDFAGYVKGAIAHQTPEQLQIWASKQTYIALGFALVAAASEQVDGTPMEGFDPTQVNEILGLGKLGLNATLLATIGYRHEEDATQHYAKVRKSNEELFINL